MAARGQGLYFLYVYIGKTSEKKILSKTMAQTVLGCPSTKILKVDICDNSIVECVTTIFLLFFWGGGGGGGGGERSGSVVECLTQD